MQSDSIATSNGSNETRPDVAALSEKDLPEAERIFRVAFGTFLGAPDPNVFWADRDYVYGRHRAPHVAAFGATIKGNLVVRSMVFTELNTAQQNEALLACQDIADTLYPGLDLTEEIRAPQGQGLGDTVLIDGTGGIGAFAVCHYGPRSEAGADACFIKFGAVRVGAAAEQTYLRLLDACDVLAVAVGDIDRYASRCAER